MAKEVLPVDKARQIMDVALSDDPIRSDKAKAFIASRNEADRRVILELITRLAFDEKDTRSQKARKFIENNDDPIITQVLDKMRNEVRREEVKAWQEVVESEVKIGQFAAKIMAKEKALQGMLKEEISFRGRG